MKLLLKTLAETEKCFLDESIYDKKDYKCGSALLGERFSLQLAYQAKELNFGEGHRDCVLEIDSPVSEYISLSRIECVNVRMPMPPGGDDGYFLRTQPGLYPDLLVPFRPERQKIWASRDLQSLWVDINIPEDAQGGKFPVKFTVKDPQNGEIYAESVFELEIIAAKLPEQEITVTQWFHPDCLAVYYGVEVFSEEHWAIMAQFIDTAVRNGINMILTPIFTPALDTVIGTERPTVQLIDVERLDGKYKFGFEKLCRFVNMCRDLGVKYYEMAHLFTQWGAGHAPKVMATTENGYERIFGWDTEAVGEDYAFFLSCLLPALIDELEKLGVAHCVSFHISDEPGGDHLENYLKAKNLVNDHLRGQKIMDALSDFSYWEKGVVECPVVSIDHAEPYIEAKVPDLWVYYCCCQWDKVSNRFLAMSTARNRIIGQQFYKYNIAGFLQWGYNFYYTCGSAEYCDPYQCTDGGYWVPAGDAFSVYPAPGGAAYETLHLLGFTAALYDLRAFRLAEKLCGREAVMSVIEERGEITFKEYPRDDEQILNVRKKINGLIKEALNK